MGYLKALVMVVLIMAAAGSLAFYATQAEASVSASAAQGVGVSIARDDCGRASDWTCDTFPTAVYTTNCAANRWCVQVGYWERNVPWVWNKRHCTTYTHFGISDGGYYYHVKAC